MSDSKTEGGSAPSLNGPHGMTQHADRMERLEIAYRSGAGIAAFFEEVAYHLRAAHAEGRAAALEAALTVAKQADCLADARKGIHRLIKGTP